MDELLSQDQIDELLKAFASGNADEIATVTEPALNVKEYNFSNPQKFGKEHLRSLELMYDGFARQLTSYLTGYLRSSTTITVANAEQAIFKEFTNTLANPVIMAIIDFNPLKGNVIFEMSAHIGFAMIDRILGGPGIALKKMREFSEIEIILLERIIVQIVGFLVEPWRNVEEITPRLERIETNAQFAQIIAPNETTALVTLAIKIGNVEGFMNFVIPHMVIESRMDRLNTRRWFMRQNMDDDEGANYSENIEEKLEHANIPIRAIIGRTRLTVGEFSSLRPGDVITLDSFVDSDLIVAVGDLHKFKGKPGVSRGKNAVKITSLINEEESTGG